MHCNGSKICIMEALKPLNNVYIDLFFCLVYLSFSMQFLHESFNYILVLLVLKTVDIDSSKNTEPEPDKVDY